MRASKIAAAALAFACAASAATVPVYAEVSAETDATGAYVRTMIFASASVKNSKIWSVHRSRRGYVPLNPEGDLSGDLWPFIADDPVGGPTPWVVWSHFNGRDYDLVWSRWTGSGWSRIADVEPGGGPDDALSPRLAFDRSGRPYVVWLTVGDVSDSVYLSVFLATRWMLPMRVSAAGEDASDPSVVALPDGAIQVRYESPEGEVVKTIRFVFPATITDDITPFGSAKVTDSTGPLTAD